HSHFINLLLIMSLTFAETHNMVAYLNKSNVSEGFNQVIDFLNENYIKYALTVNPNIYVSCIKQFWNTVAIKQVNDVTRLQSLVDKKKVVVTEAAIKEVLRLDDAEGVDCLPNEEIFAKLARMGYEKPSTKLTFYKAFFLSWWKFLIHTILQTISAKRTSWNEFSSAMASAVICLSTGRKFNFSKYIFDSLVRNVDSTSKFYMYPCFIKLLIRKQVGKLSTHTTKYTSLALTQKEMIMLLMEKFQMSLKNHPYHLLLHLLHHHNHLKIFHQHPRNTIHYHNHLRIIDEMDKDDIVALMDDKEEDKKDEEAKEDEPAEVQEVVDVVTTAKLITEVVTAASETVTAASAIISAAEPPAATITVVPAKVVAAPSRRRKGVVIRDPEDESTTSEIIPAETKSRDKGKRIMAEEPKPLKKKQQIDMDEEYARKLHDELNKDIDWNVAIDHVKLKAKEDPAVQRYQVIKRKPQTEAQARKNMMMYLKTKKEQMEEEDNRALQTINETPTQKTAKRRKLNEEVEHLKRHLEIMPGEDDDVYTYSTPLVRKLILLVERRYPLSRFTLDQMLNAVRLRVEEESEMSLELLSAVEGRLMLLSQVNAANVILMLSRLLMTSAAAETLMKK
nr:hypothetical protein [Tanacetum cinerariifolium]